MIKLRSLFVIGLLFGVLLAWGTQPGLHAQQSIKAAEGEPSAALSVAPKEAQELIGAAEEAERSKGLAQVAQDTATAAQKIADSYITKAALARQSYDRLYYKLASDMNIDLKKFKLDRRGEALQFIPKETNEKASNPSPAP